MATDILHSDQSARLECLRSICSSIASSIETARTTLRNNADDPGTANLVSDALDRVGWMADRASVVAGHGGPVVGDIDDWFFGVSLSEFCDGAAPAKLNGGAA